MSNTRISESVKCLLWARSAGRCEFDGCNQPLWRDGLTQLEMNFADVAHIIGDSPDGPRGDIVLSFEYRNDANNLMLMCHTHHRMIDRITRTYSVEVLRQMKKAHEARIERLTAITQDKTSHVIIYRGCVGGFQPKIDFQDALVAMNPIRYPADALPIELGFSNSRFEDCENIYWELEGENLKRNFDHRVKPVLDSSTDRNHFSVFAFAPQPLLIKLGTLLSDIFPADVYQFHREPPSWDWQIGPEQFAYHIHEAPSRHAIVALNLSLSATIDSQRIAATLGDQPYSEWEITIDNPNNDFLKSRAQLQLFRQEFRTLLNRIKAAHGEQSTIHLFPAVPVSVAVEIGRMRQPKADLPFLIYEQNRKNGGFLPTLRLGDDRQ